MTLKHDENGILSFQSQLSQRRNSDANDFLRQAQAQRLRRQLCIRYTHCDVVDGRRLLWHQHARAHREVTDILRLADAGLQGAAGGTRHNLPVLSAREMCPGGK